MSRFFAAVLSLVCLTGFGGSFTNKNVGVVQQQEFNEGYWPSGGAWVGGVAPGNAAGDDIAFSLALCGLYQRVFFPWVDNTAFSYGAIEGGPSSYLYFKTRSNTSLSVADPSGYAGLWTFAGPIAFSVGSSSVATPVIQNLSPMGGVCVSAADDAVSKVVVSNVVGSGMFAKTGTAPLEVRGTAGAMASLSVRKGTAVIRSAVQAGESTLEDILARADLHFDASKADSVTEEDGRVAEIRDVRDNGRAARPFTKRRDNVTPFEFVVPGPRLVKSAQNGLAVLDFGPVTDAPQGSASDVLTSKGSAALNFSTRYTQVREVFVVAADNASGGLYMSYSPDTWQNEFLRGSNGEIFSTTHGTVAVSGGSFACGCFRGGDIRVNGARVTHDYNAAGPDMKVVSYGALPYPAKDGSVTCYAPVVGFCNWQDSRFGGLRIGEYVGFSESLTPEERRMVCEYLTSKWGTAGEGKYAFDTVMLAEGSDLSVPSGESVRVRTLKTQGAFEKKGSGSLVVESLPSAQAVTIEEGTFGVSRTLLPSATPAVAASPLHHFDASDGASVKLDEQGAFERWDDVRGESFGRAVPITAEMCKHSTRAYGKPTVRKSVLNGRDVLSMGAQTYGDADHSNSAGLLFEHGDVSQAKVRSGFLVYKKTAGEGFVLGGKNDYSFHPVANYLLNATYGATALTGGKWTVDGLPQEATADACLPTDEFKLVAFEATDKVVAETIGADRILSGPYGFGGVDVAEVILYDRRLTAQERLDTEAYLMGKWFGRPHPNAAAELVAVEGRPGTQFVAEGDQTIGALLGVESVAVSGGQVVLSNDCAATMAKALVHLDASAEGTVDVVDDPTFGKVVGEWRDVRDGAAYKAVPYGAEIGCKPPAYRSDSAQYGLKGGMPVINCRSVTYNETLDPLQDSSALYFVSSADGQTKARFTTVREGVLVLRNHQGGFFVGDWGGTYDFHRGSNNSLLQPEKWASESLRSNALWRADAAVIDACTWNPASAENASQFFVVGFAITNPASASVTVSQLARDRTGANRKGGVEFAEVLLFDKALSDIERKALQASLMRKWKGTAYPGFGSFSTVDVAAGATVDFGAQTLSLARIGGSGTVKSAGVSGLSELTAHWHGDGVVDRLSVNGPVTLASNGVVQLSLDATGTRPNEPIPVLSASSIANPESIAGWTVELTGGRASWKSQLVVSGGTVFVKIVPPGTVIVVR